MGSFCKIVNRKCKTSLLLGSSKWIFKTKSKLKWIFQTKERYKTVNRRSWHNWNNLNINESSILLILEIGFLTSKSTNTLWKKNQCMSICGLFFCGTHMQWTLLFFLDIFTLKILDNTGCVYILWLLFLTISNCSFLVFELIADIVKSDASNRIFRIPWHRKSVFCMTFLWQDFFIKVVFEHTLVGSDISRMYANKFGRGSVLKDVVDRLVIFVAYQQ